MTITLLPDAIATREDYWRSLAVAADWNGLLTATGMSQTADMVIPASLWQARALRVLNQGEAANTALLKASQGPYEATAGQLAELAEELVQCAYYDVALRLTMQLQAKQLPQADYLFTMLWREREDWERCNAALARLKAHGKQWCDLARLQEAWALLRQGRIGMSTQLLTPLKTHPNTGVQKLLARLELSLGQHQAAAQRLKAVAQQQPLDWEWPPLMAAALAPELSKQNHPHLFQLYDQGLQRQPRQAEALVNRARLALSLGERQQAKADTLAALAIKPWLDAPVLLWVENALAQQKPDQAKAHLAEARRQIDTPRRSAAALDLLRFEGRKRDEIRPVAEALVQHFPNDIHALRTAGAAFQQIKMLDRAAQCYAQALALAPDDVGTRNNLAMLYRDRGDLEEAIITWRAALPQADNTVRLNYAHTLLQRGDRQEAQTIFQEVLKLQPENPVALRGLADVFYGAGEDARAWDYARQSLAADPRHPLAWRVAAGIARRLQGESQAIALLEQGESRAQPVLPLRQALFNLWRTVLPTPELVRRVKAWCHAQPHEVEYWLMAADASHDCNDFATCEMSLSEAYRIDPSQGGMALVRFYLSREREGAARRVAEQLTQNEPNTMRHWGLLSEVLYRQERYEAALEALNAGLKREPTRLSLMRQKVGVLLAREDFAAAVTSALALARAEPLPPQFALLVEALQRARQHEEAERVLQIRLQQHPGDRVLRLMLASAQRRAGHYDEALATLQALFADEPNNFKVAQRYVRALASDDRLPEAVQILQALIAKSGQQPDLLAAAAALLREQGALDEAREMLHIGLEQHPDNLDLWQQKLALEKRADDPLAETAAWKAVLARFPARRWAGYGIPALIRLKLIESMEAALNAWRSAEPNNVEPWWAAFRAAQEMKNNNLALTMLDKIEQKRGPQAEVHAARANLLQEAWSMSQAQIEIKKAIALRPDNISFREALFNILVKAGDFEEIDGLMDRLEHLLGDRRYARYQSFFFNINCHPSWSAAEVWRFYRDWYERAIKPNLPRSKHFTNECDPTRKLRIGYISPDFRRHAVAYFSEPLLMAHDKDQFDLYAYAHLDAGQSDAYTEQFKTYFQHWTETRGMSDDELERKIREDQIDILVDLAGHTSNNRLSLMLRRPAPVQATWIWGAGQTTGLPQVDYLLTDSASVPPEHDAYMAEKVARMAHPGLPFKPAHDVLEPTPLPCLTNGFITFGVLARPLRTNRNTVALWAKILHRVPTAILQFDHVPYAEADVQQRLIGYFAEHGIGPERLQFKNTRPHWQVYQKIDLQLDPFPAGSGTTASEGLYMERLVVTLKSRPPMGLIAHGQLEAMGLDRLCTADTEDEYIDKAVALVNDFQRLADLSAGLRERVKNSWLMDYAGYGREVAGMYRQMWRDWCAKQSVDAT